MTNEIITPEESLSNSIKEFWSAYYSLMKELHLSDQKELTEPLKNRNLKTTGTGHVLILEEFWRRELASALGVNPSEVGKRKVRFSPYRTKSFDVCWPLKGEPKILISVKSMQNAYRNITNRVEEAFGDSAVLRLYSSNAVFGFFFFLLDGIVPRGTAEQGQKPNKGGIPPFLALLEEGGDFFDLSRADLYKKNKSSSRGRQDSVSHTAMTLLDLAHKEISSSPTIHYDGIAFVPTKIKRTGQEDGPENWEPEFTSVDPLLDFRSFLDKLLKTAEERGVL